MSLATTLPLRTADAGKVRLGGGCRLPPSPVIPLRTADAGKVRLGGGCRLPQPRNGKPSDPDR